MYGEHRDSSTSRWTKRGFLGVPIVMWYLLAATAVLAVVGWWVVLHATGTISTGGTETQMDIAFVVGSETIDTNAACTVVINGADDIAINATGLVPGDYCEATFNVVNTGGVNAYYWGFGADWNAFGNFGLSGQWDWNDNGTPEDGADDFPNINYCGTTIPADGLPYEIGFRFDVTDGTAAGATHTFGVATGDEFDTSNDGFNFSVNPFPVGEGC